MDDYRTYNRVRDSMILKRGVDLFQFDLKTRTVRELPTEQFERSHQISTNPLFPALAMRPSHITKWEPFLNGFQGTDGKKVYWSTAAGQVYHISTVEK